MVVALVASPSKGLVSSQKSVCKLLVRAIVKFSPIKYAKYYVCASLWYKSVNDSVLEAIIFQLPGFESPQIDITVPLFNPSLNIKIGDPIVAGPYAETMLAESIQKSLVGRNFLKPSQDKCRAIGILREDPLQIIFRIFMNGQAVHYTFLGIEILSID